ncbi:MAG: PD40 domain-containing protein [Gammaproteobacteria bacterium]|nr:PD40 domain-containing protein [Gammaproteobacteria bacterium]
MQAVTKMKLAYGVILAAGMLALGGCGSNGAGGSSSATSTTDVPIAYVKRPLNTSSMNSSVGNPTDSVTYHQGGNLYILDKSSPSANAKNITGDYTKNAGDVADPEVSYDGKKIIFSMRCTTASAKVCYDYNNNAQVDTTWNIWEYDIPSGTLKRVIADSTESAKGDDVDPAYLPDGRIVFSSNRQQKTLQTIGYKYVDEYDRETSTVLHTMNADGTNVEQISFNQSHDRNPTVLSDGHIMYSRWDHVGGRNQFSIFRSNVDGAGMFIHYGAHSGVVSYLHPREMQDGRIMSDAMPLSRTNEGGALLIIDANNFSEVDQPAPSVAGSAQVQASFAPVNFGSMVSDTGRFTTPCPLWDGTNRALVSFTPGGRTEDRTQTSLITGQPETVKVEKAPAYGVYMLDLSSKGMRAIVLPNVDTNGNPTEFVTDAIPLMARAKPKVLSASGIDTTRKARNKTSITVGSIYDTEPARDRMTNSVLSAQEISAGIVIPMMNNALNSCSATDSRARYPYCDTRSSVADIAKLKDLTPGTGTEPDKRPGRFARIVKAMPSPAGISREALGETEFEMQQILGYVPVEPDGSIAFEAPADTAIGISVIDRYGRALQTHTSWLQGRPGESVFCNGCHSPRRGSEVPLNTSSLTTANNALQLNLSNSSVVNGIAGKIMAQIRFDNELALSANNVKPKQDIQYQDVWTRLDLSNPSSPATLPTVSGTTLNITYAASTFNGVASPGLTTTAPTISADGAIVINYKDHIQPILNKACISCHGVGQSQQLTLDLSSAISGTGRYASYDALLIGKPKLVNGLPVLIERDGEIVVDREEAQVEPGLARAAKLIRDWIFTEGLDRNSSAPADTQNHSAMLNSSEKRLIAEWIDLGATYFNDPCETRNGSGVCTKFRAVTGLSQAFFETNIQSQMLTQCAGCHVAVGRAAGDPPFQAKRLVLTGNAEGDFNVTSTMVNNICDPTQSYLLRYPSSSPAAVAPQPVHPHILDTSSSLYVAILQWITDAQAANGC